MMDTREYLCFIKEFISNNEITRDPCAWALDKNGQSTSLSLNTTNRLQMDIISSDRLAVYFSYGAALCRCEMLVGEKENKNNRLSDAASDYLHFAAKELDAYYTEQGTLGRTDKPYRAYHLYANHITEDFGKDGLLALLDKAISLYDAIEKFKPLWKQKLAEIKSKDNKHFVIQASTLNKYGLNNWASFYMAKNMGLEARPIALELKHVDGDWSFDRFKQD